jgi:methylmalonyl-CoA mutase C-terminal domain/subunit
MWSKFFGHNLLSLVLKDQKLFLSLAGRVPLTGGNIPQESTVRASKGRALQLAHGLDFLSIQAYRLWMEYPSRGKMNSHHQPTTNNQQPLLIMAETKIRVLLAKPGLDGHDRGVKVIARALRDAGMEVIYTGLRQTPEQIVNAAMQEDVDIVGLSILSGAHMTIFPRVVELMREKGIDDMLLFGGGIIPEDDVPKLKEAGVGAVFLPGASTEDIIKYIRESVKPRD